MGHDGRDGVKVMRDAGTEVLAQDEATSVVWGMPGAVVGAGLADEILPLDRIAAFLLARVKAGRCGGGPMSLSQTEFNFVSDAGAPGGLDRPGTR